MRIIFARNGSAMPPILDKRQVALLVYWPSSKEFDPANTRPGWNARGDQTLSGRKWLNALEWFSSCQRPFCQNYLNGVPPT